MNYNLQKSDTDLSSIPVWRGLKNFVPLLAGEKWKLVVSLFAIFVNSGLNLVAPILIGYTIDTYIVSLDFNGVLLFSGILLAIYAVASLASYVQTIVMGAVSQRLLFSLRNVIFSKLQELPVAFFNENKAGDLISRINNDTEKLNQFFSQALMQFVGNLFMIIGTGIAVIIINPRLGLAALAPAVFLLVLTRIVSSWIQRKNKKSLQSLGSLSANIQESLNNFKVIIAFHRQDYFRTRFQEVNEKNYKASLTAGIANTIFTPIYGLCSNIALLIVIAYGTHLISRDLLTIGLLISFITYVNRFYDPLRHLASLWASFQGALAGWDRITEILSLHTTLKTVDADGSAKSTALLEFRNVDFGYQNGKSVLSNINLSLEAGKTYALVGPTGGGKTTTASLMARLYDPTEGTVFFQGKDLRSYSAEERSQKIGFILQEPFLFSGTVHENLLYGNEELKDYSESELKTLLDEKQLTSLLSRFDQGLSTTISSNGEAISLGQRQLLAFIRAVLRKPDLLILDEATANIDTVTEQLLELALRALPKTTTRVIIAHRLNTIENADQIFFVNSGSITLAGSMEHAVDLLLHQSKNS